MATKEAPKSPREAPKSPRDGSKSPKVDTSGPCAPLFQGYLSKKGGSKGGRRNWKKRYFVLTGDDLRYYENYQAFISKPTQPKGAVGMRNYDKILDSTESSNEAHPFCFVLEASERKLFMSSAARMTKGEWIDAIASIGEMHKFMVAKTERSSVMLGTVENGLIEIVFKLLEKVSAVVSNVYSFIDEVNSKDPNVSNILTVVKDLGLSTCLSMRAFLRAIKFVGEYNLQACLLNADKIIGILRKLEEVTRSAVEKAAQTQKVSLITNMLGVKTLLAEDLKRVTNLAPRNRAQSTDRPLPKKGKEKDPNVNNALEALSEMAFDNSLQGGQNNPLYGHDSATNSPQVTRKKTLSDLINLAGAHVDVANDTIESMENTLNLTMSRQLTNTPRSPGPSPLASPRPNGTMENGTGNNTNVQQPAAENGEVKHVEREGVAEPVFTHSNAAYDVQPDRTVGSDNGTAATTTEAATVTTPRTPRAPESDIKAADIEMLKADIGLLSQFLTIGSPFEPDEDDPIEMLEENVKRISINDEILSEVDYDLTKPKVVTPEVPKPVEDTNDVVAETSSDSKPEDVPPPTHENNDAGDSSSSSEEITEEESDDDAVISVIAPKTPRDIVLPTLVREPTPVVAPAQPVPEEPVAQVQEQPFRSGDLVRGDSSEVSHTEAAPTQQPQAEKPVVESPPNTPAAEQGPLSNASQSSQSSEPSSASTPRSSEIAAPKPVVEYKGNNSSPSTPRGLPQIEIPKVRTSSLRSKGDRIPEITFTNAPKPSVGDEGPLSSTYTPSVKVSLTSNEKRSSFADEENDNFRLSMTYAPGQNQLGAGKKGEAKNWRRSTRFSSRISDLSNRQPGNKATSSDLPGNASAENNTNTQNNTDNAQQPLRHPAVSDLSNRAMSKSSGYFISVVYINGLHRLNIETHPMSPYLDILEDGRTDVFISLQRGIYSAWTKRKADDNQQATNGSNNNASNNNAASSPSEVDSQSSSSSSEPKEPLPEEEKKPEE
jgi:hypothetical protein